MLVAMPILQRKDNEVITGETKYLQTIRPYLPTHWTTWTQWQQPLNTHCTVYMRCVSTHMYTLYVSACVCVGGSVFVYTMLLAPPHGDPWVKWSISSHVDSFCAEADCGFVYVVLSTGCRLMAPLGACQARKSAEDLRTSQRSCHHLAHRAKRRTRIWNVGTWNVRSTCMVDTEGSIAIASTWMDREKKVEKLTWLLESWEVAGLQETKWFGCDVVLTSGRSMPTRRRW